MSAGGKYKQFYTLSPQLEVTAGTPQRLSDIALYFKWCIIYARYTNTGVIFIGSSSATAINSSTNNIVIQAGGNYIINYDLNRGISNAFNFYDLFFDGSTTGDKITIQYVR